MSKTMFKECEVKFIKDHEGGKQSLLLDTGKGESWFNVSNYSRKFSMADKNKTYNFKFGQSKTGKWYVGLEDNAPASDPFSTGGGSQTGSRPPISSGKSSEELDRIVRGNALNAASRLYSQTGASDEFWMAVEKMVKYIKDGKLEVPQQPLPDGMDEDLTQGDDEIPF